MTTEPVPPLLARLGGLVAELRAAGLPVGVSENLDAARALTLVPLADRELLREALAATTVKDAAHRPTFDTAFDLFFPLSPPDGPGRRSEPVQDADSPGPEPTDAGLADLALAEAVHAALAAGDLAALRALVAEAVTRFAGLRPGARVAGSFALGRTLRALGSDRDEPAGDAAGGPLADRLAREEQDRRRRVLREEVEAEIRRRLLADLGPEELAPLVRRPLPEDADLGTSDPELRRQLRRAIAPLTRRLASRLQRRRRHHRRGAPDLRRTIHRSLAHGGVPVVPVFRHPRPAKPALMVVADVSDSVAAHVRFTLELVQALAEQFSQVRSFVFVSSLDEVTDLIGREDDVAAVLERIRHETAAMRVPGRTDYGNALLELWTRHGRDVGRRTTVLVLGDARNNQRPTQAGALAELAAAARHVYWFNPERRTYWDTGDSVLSAYAPSCDGVHEVRTLRQLERAVEQIG